MISHVEVIAFAALIGAAVVIYVLLDGSDLGVGILFPLVARRVDASVLFASIAPFWNASETWLVFGGIVLLIGFPRAYATLMPLLSIPLAMMVASLLLRGAGYELQARASVLKRLWQWAFALGSIGAAFWQGWMLGVILEGVGPHANNGILANYGRKLFPVICGFGLVGCYALLGSCWLILKTRGAVQIFGREVAFSALIASSILLVIVSVWMSVESSHAAARWLTLSHVALFWIIATSAAILGWRLKKSLWEDRDARPLLWASLLVVVALAGTGASIYPFIVPYRYTLFEAANDAASLRFAGIGLIFVLPLMITQMLLAYRGFRRQVVPDYEVLAAAPHIRTRRTSGQGVGLHLS